MSNSTKAKDNSYLKNLLNMRINEYKMLNATLCEMVGRNSSKQVIDSMKSELDGIMSEIDKINLDIARLDKNKDDEVTYSFYDNVKKEMPNTRLAQDSSKIRNEQTSNNRNFYDSILKQSKAAQFVEDEYIKERKPTVKYNYEGIYKDAKNEPQDFTKEFVEDLRNTADSRLQANRFLVDLKDPLSIPEIMVKSIAFDPNENRVSVCIYDFVADFNGKKYPILQVLKHAPNLFDFTVKHLEADGKIMYIEKYSKCHLMEIYRDPIDYASDDFSKIQMFISYQNVEYEASK